MTNPARRLIATLAALAVIALATPGRADAPAAAPAASSSAAPSSTGSTGATGGSCPAKSSNAASDPKATLVSNYQKYQGGPLVGNGQCAVLVQTANPSLGSTTTWTPGAQVQGNCDSIPVGTVVATFNGPGNTYNTPQINGHQHTGIFLGCNSTGMILENQWGTGSGVVNSTIPWSAWGSNTAEGGSKFYVVDSPTAKGNGTGASSASGTPSSGGSGTASASCDPSQQPSQQPSQTASPSPSTTSSPSSGGASTTTPPAPAANPPATASTSTSNGMTVGDASYCWLCDMTVETMSVLGVLSGPAVQKVAAEFWPLAVSLSMFALVYRILVAVVRGTNPLKGLAAVLLRLAIAGAVVGAGRAGDGSHPVTATGAATMGQASTALPSDVDGAAPTIALSDGTSPNGTTSGDSFVADYVLGIPISLGAQIGTDIAKASASALSITAPQSSNCQYQQSSGSTSQSLSQAVTSLANLVCYVHVAGNYGVAIGGALTSAPLNATTLLDYMAAAVFYIAGIAMMLLAFNAMLSFGGALLEALLRLGIAVAFFPVFVVCAVFDSTRPIAINAARGLLFTFVFLSATGLGATVAMMVAAKGMQLGLGQTSGSLDPVALSSQAQTVMTGLDVKQVASAGTLIRFFGFDVVGFLIAGRVLKGTQELAAELTSYEAGRRGEMATAGSAMVHRIGGMAVAGAGLAFGVGARLAGGLAGSLASTAGSMALGAFRRI